MNKIRRNWSHELATFEKSKNKTRTFVLKNPTTAQVTRCRIVQTFDTPVHVRTTGNKLIFSK